MIETAVFSVLVSAPTSVAEDAGSNPARSRWTLHIKQLWRKQKSFSSVQLSSNRVSAVKSNVLLNFKKKINVLHYLALNIDFH